MPAAEPQRRRPCLGGKRAGRAQPSEPSLPGRPARRADAFPQRPGDHRHPAPHGAGAPARPDPALLAQRHRLARRRRRCCRRHPAQADQPAPPVCRTGQIARPGQPDAGHAGRPDARPVVHRAVAGGRHPGRGRHRTEPRPDERAVRHGRPEHSPGQQWRRSPGPGARTPAGRDPDGLPDAGHGRLYRYPHTARHAGIRRPADHRPDCRCAGKRPRAEPGRRHECLPDQAGRSRKAAPPDRRHAGECQAGGPDAQPHPSIAASSGHSRCAAGRLRRDCGRPCPSRIAGYRCRRRPGPGAQQGGFLSPHAGQVPRQPCRRNRPRPAPVHRQRATAGSHPQRAQPEGYRPQPGHRAAG